jgi:hypothetical protein
MGLKRDSAIGNPEVGFFASPSVISRGHERSAHDRRQRPRWPNASIPRWRAELGVRDRLTAELPGAGLRARPGLLVMSERLARRGVARGHGLAYDLNE